MRQTNGCWHTFFYTWWLNSRSSDLVRYGAKLHGHVSFPGHLFGKRMMCQSVTVSDACGVEQKGVENVLIYVGAFIIYKQTHAVDLECGFDTNDHAFPLLTHPPVSPAWKKYGSVTPRSAGRDRASLKYQRFLPLSSRPTCKSWWQSSVKKKNKKKQIKWSKLTRENREMCHFLPGQILPQHLGSPSEAEWLLSQLLWLQEPPEPWRWQQREQTEVSWSKTYTHVTRCLTACGG